METYNTNKAFKSYVDKYCKEYGLTVAEALQDSIVQEVEKQHIKNASMVAVEKQKPMKPIKTETEGYMFTDTYRCPTCGGNFSGTGIADYCYHCGQKLDWSDPDDKLD